MRVMVIYTLCFLVGWAAGSFAIYTYMTLSARGAASEEIEPEEQEEAIAA